LGFPCQSMAGQGRSRRWGRAMHIRAVQLRDTGEEVSEEGLGKQRGVRSTDSDCGAKGEKKKRTKTVPSGMQGKKKRGDFVVERGRSLKLIRGGIGEIKTINLGTERTAPTVLRKRRVTKIGREKDCDISP